MNPKTRVFIPYLLFIFSIGILLITAWVSDDAFITLRTVDNWTHGYGLTWNVNERVQTFTHPLWMFLLTGLYFFIPNGYFATITLSLITSLTLMALFLNQYKNDLFILVFGWTALIFSKAFVDYSTSGLENPLSHLLMLLFAIEFLKSELPIDKHKMVKLAFIAGLGTLNRMDTLLFFAPVLTYLYLFHQRNRNGIKALTAGFLPFLIWELFSIFYYGFLFPNTAYAKLNASVSKATLLHQGVIYFQNSLSLDPITLLTIAVAIGSSIYYHSLKERLLTTGMGLYLVYILYIGGDFMSGRFFSTAMLLSIIILLQFAKNFDSKGKYTLATTILVFGLLLPSLSSTWRTPTNLDDTDLASKAIDSTSGISDERLFYFSTNSLINMDKKAGMPDHIWAKLGKEYRTQGKVVKVVDATGMVGYYAGPTVHIVDSWAICDPLRSRIKSYEPNPRIGHFTRPPIDGYLETLQTGRNQIMDPSLAEYYDKLKFVISGELWSPERLKTIWEINTGRYDYLITE